MKSLSYEERLRGYERDKAKLRMQPLTDKEYEQAVRKLADKWRV